MRIALIQMAIETGGRSANLVRALQWIDRACDQDPAPDLIVLPESCDLGVAAPDAAAMAEPVGGPFAESLAAKAREMGVHVAAGLTERDVGGLYSAGVLFDVDGDVLLRHRRIHLDPCQRETYTSGDRLRVRQTPWGCVGIQVSADLDLPCLTDALAAMGAALIIVPGAWTCGPGGESSDVRALEACAVERTKTAPVVLVSVNGVGAIEKGPLKDRALYGNSMVYAPGGRELLVGPRHEEAMLTVDVETDGEGPAGRPPSKGT